MGYAERANTERTVDVRDDGVKLEKDPSGYSLFIPSSPNRVHPRALADAFGFTRHELGAPHVDPLRGGTYIAICPKVRYACCPAKSYQWSDICAAGFGSLCPDHSGPIEFIYERQEVESKSQVLES